MKTESKETRIENPATNTGNGKELKDMEEEFNTVLAAIIRKVLNKPDSKTKMLPLANALLADWAGNSFFKKRISGIVVKRLAKPPKQKTKNAATDTSVAADVGRLVTLRWKIRSEKSRKNPMYKNDNLISILTDFLKNSDFGELKEYIVLSKEGGLDLTRKMNMLLEKYPGKLMAIAGAMPTIVSRIVGSLLLMMKNQNQNAPDVSMSMKSSLAEAIDGKEIGQLLNEKFELTRKSHIGSLLQGDGKTPALETMYIKKLREILPEINHEIFGKMKIGVKENAEAKSNAFSTALTEFPEFAKVLISIFPRLINSSVRVAKRRVDILESLPNEELSDTVVRGFAKLDTLDIADLVSAVLRVLNSIHDNKPDLVMNTLSSIASAIDVDELERVAGGIIKDAVVAVKPAARAVMSSLLDGICEILTPEPGEDSDGLDKSLARFGRILNGVREA